MRDNNRRIDSIKSAAIFILFAFCFFLTFGFIVLFRHSGQMTASLTGWGNVLAVFLYCLVLFVLLAYLESFRIGQRRILDLGFGFFSASLTVNFFLWLVMICLLHERVLYALVFCVLQLLWQCVAGVLWILLCHRHYEKIHFVKEAIFIYGNRENDEYIRIHNTISRYFKIRETIHFEVGLEEILQMMPQNAVVFIGDVPGEVRNPLLKYCMSNGIQCYSIPKISDIYLQNAEVMQLHDKLLFQYPRLEITGTKRFVKRSMDVVGATIMLAIFGIPMLIFAIKIKKEDGGPVFFYQDRISINGKPFQMIKFRSMRVDAESGGARLASKHDDRITRIGKKLRNTHMDELPQLINILRGDMSLVGPRPERQDFADYYEARIPEFSDRLKVKAGLTGYAQIYGKYNTAAEDKIKYDLYYIYNHSIALDIKILILTVRILFQKENTAGIPDGHIYAIREHTEKSADGVGKGSAVSASEKERESTADMPAEANAISVCDE